MDKIDVLDHGYIRLIDHMGSDLSVVRAARVSYAAEWRAGKDKGSDEALIKYLWENKHTTPFESVEFQFEVYAPIFVARQWMRHRTWSYNEVSGRYTALPEEFYVPRIEDIGTQSKVNKQARSFNPLDEETKRKRETEVINFRDQCKESFNTYKYLLDGGWPRELARMVLPLNTYTHFFAKTDLLNLLKFIKLRDHEHAQYEIQVYAQAARELIEPIIPVTMKIFNGS